MKIVDLHPDDLLDKEAEGALSDVERERLDAHLARCETCRFEREARADFADELAEEEELSSQRLALLMEGAAPSLVATRDETPAPPSADDEPAPPARVSTRPSRSRRALRVGLLAAAALFIGTAATAGGGHVWTSVASVLHLTAEEPPAPPKAPSTPATTHATMTAPSLVSAPLPDERVEPTTDEPPAPPARAIAAPVETAASLFDEASRARSAGDYGRAIALHRKLEASYPSSREAHASHATLGRLLLDRGDAAGALAAFHAYEARGPGPMDEAVMVGTATALERLGRDAEARATWARLVTSFPDTPYREHANTRLAREGR